MEHIALYRKWRPQTFDDLVGQEHISKTLLNAIQTNRITHAYMFCGSRGTGKTTTARILAKSLNCDARINGSPCNKCPSCIELTSGKSLDVIEIDAASNRGIDEIRSLIEQVRFASVSGKYKVYIIDEFHMLTDPANNALLKTLEEPPPKVIFVLATTEAHKILPTIVSRCQRFDFQRISVSALFGRLKYISEQEVIKISDDSILSIARKANGGLRDAISLLDQISSFSVKNTEIPTETVLQILGMVSAEFLSQLAESIAKREPVKIIQTLAELLRAGNDPVVIMSETISFFRNLLIIRSAPEMAEYLEVPIVNIDQLRKTAQLFTADDILNNLEYLNEAIERVKKTQQAQLWLEVNFVQLCNKRKTVNFSNEQEILNKISELEKKIELLNSRNYSAPFEHKTEEIQKIKSNQPFNTEISENTDINQYKESKTSQLNNNTSIWDRILQETKKKSIPAEALLSKGMLSDIDKNNHTVTVKFENDGFIELLRKSKYQKVEEALTVVFGVSYKLLMEKGELFKEEKKNNNSKESKNLNPEHKTSSNSTKSESGDISKSHDIQTNSDYFYNQSTNGSDFSDKIDNTQDQKQYVNEKEIKSEKIFIKEDSKDYGSVSAEAGKILDESEMNYFSDVAQTFKGKIINKIKI